jgi:O-antigen biosynthesis protein
MISVLIPTKNKPDLLNKCLRSLEIACSGCTEVKEIVVLDGGDNVDITVEQLRNFAIPKPTMIEVEKWWNYSQIHNYALKYLDTDNLLFLNNDCYLHPEFFDLIEESKMETTGYLLVYPKVPGECNSGVDLKEHLIQHAGISLFRGVPNHIAFMSRVGYYNPPDFLYVPAVTFACALVPYFIIDQIGCLDEEFNFGYEDVDFCLRSWEKGFKVKIDNSMLCLHEGAVSQDAAFRSLYKHSSSRNLDILRKKWPDKKLSEILAKVDKS